MQKIRKGDEVVVIAGRDKGKRGTVLRRVDAQHVVVEGVNRVKKHQRPNPVKGQTGGIVDKEAPLAISNVMLVNPATGKGDRVGFKFLEAQGGQAPRKVRFFKSNGEVVDV
jgi:large subunit ribosomal protein L24